MAFVDEVDDRAQMWVCSLTDGPATQITFVDKPVLKWTRWSPSGHEIYFNYQGGIWSVPVVGGGPRNIGRAREESEPVSRRPDARL